MKATEVKLTYIRQGTGILIKSSKDVYEVLLGFWDVDTIDHCESFVTVLLSQRHEVLGILKVSEGGISGCLVDVRKIFQGAILANASAIIVAHNHPSGNLKPSQQDISITNRIKDAGKLMQINLLDHLIITSEGYLSMADDGIM